MPNKNKQVDNAAENRSEIPNRTTIEAIEEGRRIAGDPNVKGFSSMEELVAKLSGERENIMNDVKEGKAHFSDHGLIENESEGVVKIANSAVYAMQAFRKEMTGEAEKAGLSTEDDVIDFVKEMRTEGLD